MNDAALHLGLASEDETVAATVRLYCPAPHVIETVATSTLVDAHGSLSAEGRRVIARAPMWAAVLIDWQFEQAPIINTLCYHIRAQGPAPLLALCRSREAEHVEAQAAGADDALFFPFTPALVQAKVLAYHRLVCTVRPAEDPAVDSPEAIMQLGPLRLDRAGHRFFVEDEEVDLTAREFTLLEVLVRRAGSLCTRERLLAEVWGLDFDTGTNMVDVYVHFLRRKLAPFGLDGTIHTVRGQGYRLALPRGTSSEDRPEPEDRPGP